MEQQVLIVGAGPTGLVLALWLTRLGISYRVIDKASGPGTTSRAMVVHARTLEFYRQLGIADRVIAAGEKATVLNAHLNRKRIARIPFGDFGEGQSAYPFMLVLPQDVHERLLEDELRKAGIEIERDSELVGLDETDQNASALLKTARGEERLTVAYLCGCDGAHSPVRETLGIDFPGGTYQQVFYVTDAAVNGPMADDEVHFAFSDRNMLAVFPLKLRTDWRIIGIVPRAISKPLHDITYDDVGGQIWRVGGLQASRVNWFSTYHVHHRVAASFRRGKVFLLGDASHIHSPAGGQGMNTGIGDASNLGWKLAAVLQGRAAPALLDSYAAERAAIARRIVRSTDRIFSFQVSPSWTMRTARRWVTPVMPGLMRFGGVRRFVFRTISQIAFTYRESPISSGSAGPVHAGDRLPWVRLDSGGDNYRALRNLDWQIHSYGNSTTALVEICKGNRVPLWRFPRSRASDAAGLQESAAYLVRPDGHIGLIAAKDRASAIGDYLSRLRIKPRVEA